MNTVRRANSSSAPHDDLVLRRAGESDYDFLLELRKETMSSYLAAVGLPTDDAAHCERILYRFDCAFIVCLAGRPVGLFKYYRDVHGWHIVQIQIARQQQGRGMGTRLLSTVLDEACRNQQAARLGVLKSNPAKQLYERLGFEVVSEDREEYAMLFRPGNENLTYAASAQHLR